MVAIPAMSCRMPNETYLPGEIERNAGLILRIMRGSSEPVGPRQIANRLNDYGEALSERSVRSHLESMDELGLTESVGGHDAYLITARGMEELAQASLRNRVSFVIAKIEALAFRTTLDPQTLRGDVPVNISLFPKGQLGRVLGAMKPVFEAGLCVSELIALAREGERLGDTVVPAGKFGVATVSSTAISGFLLKRGIPMDSKFGGILEMKGGLPLRFVELIYYADSSLDPSEVFIQGNMTSVRKVSAGRGGVLANFREIPAPTLGRVKKLLADLGKARLYGVLSIGEIGEPVCQTPVGSGNIGMILAGGLNPVASAREKGLEAENHATSTIMEYQSLTPFSVICAGLKRGIAP